MPHKLFNVINLVKLNTSVISVLLILLLTFTIQPMIGNTSATDYSPTKITISTGQLVSGSNASLSSQDGSFLVINSTQQGSYYITDWYAEFTLSSRQIANLSIADSGKYSTWRGQTLYLYNFSTSSWEIINYSNIGMVMVNVNLPSVANPASYVSAEGKVWLKSYCLSTSSFTAYTDYLKLGVTFGATPAPAANKVAFTSQPGLSNISGTAFGTQPAVNIQDASGNTVTASNAAVTLAITKGTGTKGAALLGTATVSAVNGVATFSGLSINLADTGYILKASSPGLTSTTSTAFNVSAATIAGGEVVVANFIAGDANGDGVVNMADVAKVQRIILGLDSPTPGADADGDGIVSMGDVTKIERIILGLNP